VSNYKNDVRLSGDVQSVTGVNCIVVSFVCIKTGVVPTSTIMATIIPSSHIQISACDIYCDKEFLFSHMNDDISSIYQEG